MKNIHLFLSCLCVLALGLSACRSDQAPPADQRAIEPATCGSVTNLHRIGDVYVAGKPSVEDYPLIKEMGIRTVLNIRVDSETPDVDEAALVRAQGMDYVHVPWNGPEQLNDDKLDAMRKALRQAKRPILFHCGSGNRVGAGWLAYRVLDEGVALESALAEVKTFGLKTPAYETITLDYIARKQAP